MCERERGGGGGTESVWCVQCVYLYVFTCTCTYLYIASMCMLFCVTTTLSCASCGGWREQYAVVCPSGDLLIELVGQL